MELTHTAQDRAIVVAQLGREPRGSWGVAARCHLGLPMVIENSPLAEGEPFPTLFWLTCPLLVKRASRLEGGGHMARVNDRLQRRGELHGRLAGALRRYIRRRDAHEVIEDAGAPPGGGPDKVKCLHAHLAHELADPPNPVGAETLALCGYPDCRTPCVVSRP
ncbi:MAG TPA: DUF501 domain-containing protein [Actinomycetota bacterium]|nr:DUF501 domain-containing protein [Actinomycetota bacterium]